MAEKTNKILVLELLHFAHDWEAEQALASAEIGISLFTADSDPQLADLLPQDPSCSQLSQGWLILLPHPLFTKKVHINNIGTHGKQEKFLFSTDFSPPGQIGLKVQKSLASSFPYCSPHLL